jgi:hypothetical protein
MPTAASNAYSRNIATLLEYLTADGALAIDTSDEIQAGVVITHDGRVVQESVAALLGPQPEPAAPELTAREQPEQREPAGPEQTAWESEGGADVDGLGD